MNRNAINERISLAYKESGYRSVNAMAKALGVAQTTLNACVLGTTEPRATLLTAILVGLPDLSADWLMTGKGPMRRSRPQEAAPPAPTAFKAEVERLRAVIECKDGEIAFLRSALTGRKG